MSPIDILIAIIRRMALVVRCKQGESVPFCPSLKAAETEVEIGSPAPDLNEDCPIWQVGPLQDRSH
jgi:hypothetical protein